MAYTPATFFSLTVTALDQIDQTAIRLFDTFDETALTRIPRPGSWSAVQCFEHLVKINRIYIAALDRALEAPGAKSARETPFSHSWFERYFIWTLEPPARMKLPAPKLIAPSKGWIDPKYIRSAYFETHREFRDSLDRARRVDIKRAKVVSPISTLIRWSAAAAIDVMLAHERRHLWQAERAAATHTENVHPIERPSAS